MRSLIIRAASFFALEQIEEVLRQIVVERVVDIDLILAGARLARLAPASLRPEPSDRLAGLGDHDLLAQAHALEQLKDTRSSSSKKCVFAS